jgi:hypothetical protein
MVNLSSFCGDRILRYYDKTGVFASHQDARLAVARDHPLECGACDPASCRPHQTIFRRPDRMAPLIVAATTHYLTHVHPQQRLPVGVNRTEFFQSEANQHHQRNYLFEYNPSIIVLPDEQRASVHGETAYYLASYRVTTMHICVHDDEELLMLGNPERKRPQQMDYLGLACLRNDLSILQDVVVDVQVLTRFPVEDFRLFVFQPNNQIVVSSKDVIFPLWFDININSPTTRSNSSGTSSIRITNETVIEIPQQTPSPMKVYTQKEPACTPFIGRGGGYNKNINFFIGDDQRVVAEFRPMVAKYLLPAGSPLSPCVRTDRSAPDLRSSLTPPRSFGTVDILHFWHQNLFNPYTDERGSACCASLNHPVSGERLLLGISHSKTPYGQPGRTGDVPANHFFSSLYVMESTAPYSVVARSGRFCLGHATTAELATNPFARDNLTPLRIDREYDCPRIHFVSGISEVVDDPSCIIIGYGVNDCAPRFVKVKKSDLVQLLFMDLV